VSFATHLLECFGWKDGRPDGAEIPRLFAIADAGQRVEREVALWWPERRTMMEVAAHDVVLEFAWKDLLRVCLQLDPVPQYVVLTNQRDLHLYDLARDREAPRLAIRMDDLPKYSEAFPFFTTEWVPGATPRIVNVEKVSTEVADLVARLYRSVRAQHPKREHDVIRFTLQCITAMFAEDIGLLPANYFTSLLYDGARDGKVEPRLRQLFEQMNTRDLPAPRVVPYFNGGLFTDAVTLPLGSEQVVALTKAAEANWTYVDPHIFGSVFQGIMDDAERHASGAHYTAHDDIMRVVGPTIVEPWRKRIQAATSLKELTELRKELFAYRVLDPACGSGNFLYVAFRELYRLDTELLSRMREFRSTQGKLSWNGGITTTNFYGIDINPFAVELAKVTLNIAKKIAFEERKAQAFALAGQVEMDIDPSLPLDNLDKNIVCADALFSEWPEVDAIVGNPPFLAGTNISGELGAPHLARLRAAFPNVHGKADYCSYWFRRNLSTSLRHRYALVE
jgi:SAM-dependent methyltransferase